MSFTVSSYTSSISSFQTDNSSPIAVSAGYYVEPSMLNQLSFPTSIDPSNSNNFISIGATTFNDSGPISFSDIGLFIAEAKGDVINNFSLNNLFLEANQYDISLSGEADFLKPHKASEFYGSTIAGNLPQGPYGNYYAWVEVLSSEGGYGLDSIIESNPVADGCVRVLAENVHPKTGQSILADKKFLAFKLKTNAPAGKWVKYTIKCFNVLRNINHEHLQNAWVLADSEKYFDFYYSNTNGKSNLTPMTSMVKTYTSLAGFSTNKWLNYGGWDPNRGIGIGAFQYSIVPIGEYYDSSYQIWLFTDPAKLNNTIIAFNDNGTIQWVGGNRITELWRNFRPSELFNNGKNILLNYGTYINFLTIGDKNKASVLRIIYDLVRKGEFVGTNFYGASSDIGIYLHTWGGIQMNRDRNPLLIHSNGSTSRVSSTLMPAISDYRYNNDLEINSTDGHADFENLHTVLHSDYFDYSLSNEKTNRYASFGDMYEGEGARGYYYQEGLARIQNSNGSYNEATAYVYFPKNCYPEGNILIEADNITDFGLTKVEDSPGNYGIVSGQFLLNLESIDSSRNIDPPSVAEKNTALEIWENFYLNREAYYVNNLNEVQLKVDMGDSNTQGIGKYTSNWCHVRTPHYVYHQNKYKEDLLSQHQRDTFKAYYDNITLSSAPQAPTRSYYRSSWNLNHKTLGKMLVPSDLQFNDGNSYFPKDINSIFLTYHFDIPVRYKNYISIACQYVTDLLRYRIPLQINIKKMDQDQLSEGRMMTTSKFIDSFVGNIDANAYYVSSSTKFLTNFDVYINQELFFLEDENLSKVGYLSSDDGAFTKYDQSNRFTMMFIQQILRGAFLNSHTIGNSKIFVSSTSNPDYGLYASHCPPGSGGIQVFTWNNNGFERLSDTQRVVTNHGSNTFTFPLNYGKKITIDHTLASGGINITSFSSTQNSCTVTFSRVIKNGESVIFTNSFAVMYNWYFLVSYGVSSLFQHIAAGISIHKDFFIADSPQIEEQLTGATYGYEVLSEKCVDVNQYKNLSTSISFITMGFLLDMGLELNTLTSEVISQGDIFLLGSKKNHYGSHAFMDRWHQDKASVVILPQINPD